MQAEASWRAVRRGNRLAAAWMGAIALTAAAAWVSHRARQGDVPPPRAPMTAEQQSLARDIERHALNALLVPLIDHEASPMRWADPSLVMACGGSTQVWVDGRPLQPGTSIASRAFVVAWTLQGCLPFGSGGPQLTGRAELRVSRQMDGFAAMVSLTDLQVQRQEQRVVISKEFFAHLR
jgi:hypothetical protein